MVWYGILEFNVPLDITIIIIHGGVWIWVLGVGMHTSTYRRVRALAQHFLLSVRTLKAGRPTHEPSLTADTDGRQWRCVCTGNRQVDRQCRPSAMLFCLTAKKTVVRLPISCTSSTAWWCQVSPVSMATGTNTWVLDSWLYLVFLLVAAWLAAAPASLAVLTTWESAYVSGTVYINVPS